jgi:HEAT repeat protein
MVYEADPNFLEDDIDLDSPLDTLDTLAVLDANPEPLQPDPEAMLRLLTNAVPSQRMLAARAFCEIQEPRAIPMG